MGLFGLFGKKKEATQEAAERQALDDGLERSRTGLFGRITRAIAGKTSIDDEVLDELEEILVSSDVGVDTTLRIIERIQARLADHWMFTGPDGERRMHTLTMCEDCRVEEVVNQGFDPHDDTTRRVRTTPARPPSAKDRPTR